MNYKIFFLFATSIFFASTGANAYTLDSDGILRSELDGKIVTKNWSNAHGACPQGTHLPTCRELLKLSQARGAKGILEMSQVDPRAVPAGYRKIFVTSGSGERDEFYYSKEGYERPSGDLGNLMFWSSQYFSDKNYIGCSLDGHDGSVRGDVWSESTLAIRCVPGRLIRCAHARVTCDSLVLHFAPWLLVWSNSSDAMLGELAPSFSTIFPPIQGIHRLPESLLVTDFIA